MSSLQASRRSIMAITPSIGAENATQYTQSNAGINLGQTNRGRTVILPYQSTGPTNGQPTPLSWSHSSQSSQPSQSSTYSADPTAYTSASQWEPTPSTPSMEQLLYSYGLTPISLLQLSDRSYLIKCYTTMCEAIYVTSTSSLGSDFDITILSPGPVEMDMSIKRGLVDIIGNMAGKILLVDGVGCIIISNDYSNKEQHYLLNSGNQTASVLPEAFPIYSPDELVDPQLIMMANDTCARIRDYCSRLGQTIFTSLAKQTVSLNELIVAYMEGWTRTLTDFRKEEGNLTSLLVQLNPDDPVYCKIRNSLCLVKTFITRMNQLTISSIQLNGWTIPQLSQLIEQYNRELSTNIDKFNLSLANL